MRRFWFCLAAVWAAAHGGELRIAATTSLDNSGLLEYLLPAFEQHCNCKVRALAVGSGAALAFGRRGDVDALIAHAPAAEKEFVAEGFGILRQTIMANDFVLVGPPDDPAGAANHKTIAEALKNLPAKGRFVSRGDQSGTHQKEMEIWHAIGGAPEGQWYVESGAGMGQTLLLADELRAYTISDRGTYLAFREKTANRIALQNDPVLQNPYSIIVVNPARHPHAKYKLARQFAKWLASPAAQTLIGEYRWFGEPLFKPVH